MNREMDCPRCETEFEVEEWEDGNCPVCDLPYGWDEIVYEDYSNSWTLCIFDSFNKEV